MKKSFSSYVKDYLMLAVLVALIILFSILGPAMANRAFFNFSNLLTMLNQNAYLVILGVGITFIMLGGGMDLSTGYLISTVGVAMALIGQLHPLATIVVAIFFAALRVGSTTMQAATGVPTSVSDIIQALVIVFTVAGLAMVKLPGFKAFLGRLTERRKEAA